MLPAPTAPPGARLAHWGRTSSRRQCGRQSPQNHQKEDCCGGESGRCGEADSEASRKTRADKAASRVGRATAARTTTQPAKHSGAQPSRSVRQHICRRRRSSSSSSGGSGSGQTETGSYRRRGKTLPGTHWWWPSARVDWSSLAGEREYQHQMRSGQVLSTPLPCPLQKIVVLRSPSGWSAGCQGRAAAGSLYTVLHFDSRTTILAAPLGRGLLT